MSNMTRRSAVGAVAGAFTAAWAQSRLRIEKVDHHKVVVPMKKGTAVSLDYPNLDRRLAEFDRYPKFILEIHASNGMTGIGETARQVPEESVRANAAHLRGRGLGDIDLGRESLGLPDPRTADAFEMAIYDLMGKTLGVPVCDLLGGRKQDKVAVSYWTGQRTIPDLLMVGRRAVELGFKNLKFKGRFGDPIVDQLDAVAKECPGLSFIIDFNSSYPDPGSFLPVAHRMQGYNVTIEDPVPKRLDWFHQLRDRLTIPFALTPSGPQQMFEAIRTGAVDVFNLGGDMRTFARMCHTAELGGIPAWHGSGAELGVRDMSFVHAAAATRACTIPSDTICFLRESDLLAQPFRVKDGFVDVPRSPGLGVDLDRDALKRFTVA